MINQADKTPLRRGLPVPPARIAKLPRNDKGYPVPYFVAWYGDRPDFRVVDPEKMIRCVNYKRCWLCGEPLGRYLAFTLGPMCAVNRISSEPPSHRECAEYAVQACPFLLHPKAHRRVSDMPEDYGEPGGVHILRNPGVALIWITKSYRVKRAPNGVLFEVGEPTETLWFTEGRPATYDEAFQALKEGVAELNKIAILQGELAIFALIQYVDRAMQYLPVGRKLQHD